MRPTSTRRGFFAAALAAFAALGLSAGKADAGYTHQTFAINYSNVYGTATFGTVKVEAYSDTGGSGITGDRVTFTVSALNVYGSGVTRLRWENFGFNTTLNLTLTEGVNLSVTPGSGFSGVTKNKNLDGFGTFDQVLDWNPDAGVATIQFTIYGLTATQATIANFTEFNSDGSNKSASGKAKWAYAGHIKGDGLSSGTHFVGAGDSDDDGTVDLLGEAVPAPPAVILAVMGVGLFGFVGRRMRRQAAV